MIGHSGAEFSFLSTYFCEWQCRWTLHSSKNVLIFKIQCANFLIDWNPHKEKSRKPCRLHIRETGRKQAFFPFPLSLFFLFGCKALFSSHIAKEKKTFPPSLLFTPLSFSLPILFSLSFPFSFPFPSSSPTAWYYCPPPLFIILAGGFFFNLFFSFSLNYELNHVMVEIHDLCDLPLDLFCQQSTRCTTRTKVDWMEQP